MRVGFIGNGNVGSALSQGVGRAGHEVRATGKDPAKVKEIAKWADLVVLAVPFGERKNAVGEMGAAVSGKTIVDVTNVLGENGDFVGDVDQSGAEELQRLVANSNVVKAFNTVFAEHMSSGKLGAEPLTTFVAGDNEEAKREVADLAREIGFDAVDAGPLENARWLETLGYFNIELGYEQELGTKIGFKLIRGEKAPEREERAATRKRA